MNKTNIKICQPTYYKKFLCDGANCEDSCCIGEWNIYINKKNYKKLKGIRDKKIKDKISKYIKRNKSKIINEDNYAKIICLENTGSCPFLNEKRLCSLQIKLGEEYLSKVCTIYPRIISYINHELERSLTLSCPIAANLVLKNEDGISFEIINEEKDNKITLSGEHIFNESDCEDKIENNMWEIRSFSIQIIKSSDYEIGERLIILGLFIEELKKIQDKESTLTVFKLIEKYEKLIVNGSFKGIFDNVPVMLKIQIKLLKDIADLNFMKNKSVKRYNECFYEAITGMGFIDEFNYEDVEKNYKNAYEKYYKEFIMKKGFIIENYVVNYMFQHIFPFGNKTSLWDNYVMLIMHYALIKMHLIGMMAYHKENFNDELVVKLIQSFVKKYEHDKTFEDFINELIKQNKFNTMAYMTILIKN